MTEQSRRQFLQTSTGAVGAAGLVSTVGLTSATPHQSSVPAYAEFVPTGDLILLRRGELELGTYTLDAQIALFGQIQGSDSIPLQFEPLIYSTLLLEFWQLLGRANIGEEILGSLSDFTVVDDINDVSASNVPAERHTLIGTTSLYSGPFDIGAIESAVQESDASETSTSGIYEYPTGEIVTWGEGYLLLGTSVDQVAAIQQTGDGPDQPRYEQNPELATLLRAVDHGGHTLTRLTDDGTLSVSEYGQGLDHSPLEGTTGYIGTLSYDSDATEFSATTVARYPDEGSAATDRLGEMVVQELDSNVTTEGRTARVTASYDRAEAGLAPDDTSDGSGGTDNTTNDTADGGMDQQSGDSESADDGGPGFGAATALSSLGGAGYLLKRRLRKDGK